MVLRWFHNCKLFLASAIVSFVHNCVVCDMLCFSQDAGFDLNLLSLFQEGHLSAHQGHLYRQEKVRPFWILMYGACFLAKATNLQSNSVSKNWNLNWKKKTPATYLRKVARNPRDTPEDTRHTCAFILRRNLILLVSNVFRHYSVLLMLYMPSIIEWSHASSTHCSHWMQTYDLD